MMLNDKDLKKKMRRLMFAILASTTGKHDLWHFDRRDELKDKLKEFGFAKLKHEHNNFQVWINKKLGLVFKASLVILPYRKKASWRPIWAVPTVLLPAFNGQKAPDTFWLMQPFVDTSENALTRVREMINGKFSFGQLSDAFGEDFAVRNMGVWRGRIVTFDW